MKNYNLEKLTVRELEILQLIRYGYSSKEISQKIDLSLNTVNTHRKHIWKKLGIKNIGELYIAASQMVT